MMSTAMKTTVPHSPIAAAPARPSPWRAAVIRPGRKLTATPVASTINASSSCWGRTAVTCRDTTRNATTPAAVIRPISVPPTITVRKSQRSAERPGPRPHPQHRSGPEEQRERREDARDRQSEARAHAKDQRQRPVTAPAVLIELIQLSEGIEPCEQGAEREQDEGVAQVERPAGRGPRRERRERPEPHHVDQPVRAGHRLEPKRWHGIQQ